MTKKIGNSYDYRTLREFINANHDRFSSLNYDDSMSLLQKMEALVEFFKVMLQEYDEWIKYLDEFQDNFDTNLYKTTEDILNKWLNDGVFETIINENILKDLNDKIDRIDNIKLDKNGKINVGNLGQDVLELLSGDKVAIVGLNSIDSDNIKLKSIMPNRLEYIPPKSKIVSKNLFNKNFIHTNSMLKTDGSIQANNVPELSLNVSDYIEVKPSTQYRGNARSNRQIAFYNENGVFTRLVENTYLFETTSSEKFIRFTFESQYLNETMFYEGHDTQPYEEYRIELEPDMIGDNSIEDSKMISSYPKNNVIKPLFLKENALKDMYVSYLTGVVSANAGYYASDFIPIEYQMRYEKTSDDQFAFYDENKNFVNGMEKGLSFYNDDARLKYIRITVKSADVDNFVFAKGSIGKSKTQTIIKSEFYGDKTIPDSAMIEKYLILHKTRNIFTTYNKLNSFYVSYQSGVLNTSVPTISVTDFIPMKEKTSYQFTNISQVAFFDTNYKYVGGSSTNGLVVTPEKTAFARVTYSENQSQSVMIAETTSLLPYENKDGVVTIDQLDNEIVAKLENSSNTFDLLIPDTIYLTKGEEFNIYYQNVITNGLNFNDYTFKIQETTASGYQAIGSHLNYKWFYTPSDVGEKTIIIQIRNSYDNAIRNQKTVKLVINDILKNNVVMVTTGDSFTDGYGISKYIYQFVNSDKLKMVGLNATGIPEAKDDAWSGYSYNWLAETEFGYLRSDRPLNDRDNVWDSGWGENEPNGWTTGQTYDDLTPEQISHGKTRNQFYNPEKKYFDFTYYMNRYSIDNNVNTFACLMGINDCLLIDTNDLINKLPSLKTKIENIFNSVLDYKSTIKIIPILITPLNDVENDMFINSYGNNFNTAKRSKRNVEIFNKFMVDNFNTSEWISKGVMLASVNANFDYRYGILKKEISPVKFDTTIKENVSSDIHPTEIGAKYIADTMRNWIINL